MICVKLFDSGLNQFRKQIVIDLEALELLLDSGVASLVHVSPFHSNATHFVWICAVDKMEQAESALQFKGYALHSQELRQITFDNLI